ncbi:hypothetical protein XELAEV_18025919mg [Xenopus laevis]|uniref:Uncharacterized protein n=1 Tax=Xenopus laevis TaxID=8355 RepID=A0A974D0H1_XENLA|nr:hypothetical protein XELAEV_18025919mg [Xenopus laevis]
MNELNSQGYGLMYDGMPVNVQVTAMSSSGLLQYWPWVKEKESLVPGSECAILKQDRTGVKKLVTPDSPVTKGVAIEVGPGGIEAYIRP